jgi:hypothetical protein
MQWPTGETHEYLGLCRWAEDMARTIRGHAKLDRLRRRTKEDYESDEERLALLERLRRAAAVLGDGGERAEIEDLYMTTIYEEFDLERLKTFLTWVMKQKFGDRMPQDLLDRLMETFWTWAVRHKFTGRMPKELQDELMATLDSVLQSGRIRTSDVG